MPQPDRIGGFERFFRTHGNEIAGSLVAAGFLWRVWLAHTTFFNTDEAWHWSVANQPSFLAAYRASLTLAHPPLMVVVLHFWRLVGTSDLTLRLPGVLAGIVFCWIYYRWLQNLFGNAVALAGLVFASLLPPWITLSAELRQYTWLLMFAVLAAYFLERALADNSPSAMIWSSVALWLAILSHYSAFLFAASFGAYAVLRIIQQRPRAAVVATWLAGQAAALALTAFLYKNHIAHLGAVYPVAHPIERFGDFYLSEWYFHPGRDHLAYFLYRGTFGVFRFAVGQTAVGQIAAVVFFVGVLLLLRKPSPETAAPSNREKAWLLLLPFALSWIAVMAGLYPYGRTRQCFFLAMFGVAGVSVALTWLCRGRSGAATLAALGLVALCHVFGTLQGRDMLPLSEQRHQHMDAALQLIRTSVSPDDVILTDKATSYQLQHYLCGAEPARQATSWQGLESYMCGGIRIATTGSADGALAPAMVGSAWSRMNENSSHPQQLWVVEGGWATGLSDALRRDNPAFYQIQAQSFGRYLEVIRLPPPQRGAG